MVSVVISAMLAPKPTQPPPAGIGDFTVPTAEQNRTIPVIFGKVWITGPNVVWYGELASTPITKKTKGLFSDPRLKEDIELVGKDFNTGLNIYHFNYIGGLQRYEGVMADEVALIYPEAVTVNEDNLMMVYYDKLGISMRKVH